MLLAPVEAVAQQAHQLIDGDWVFVDDPEMRWTFDAGKNILVQMEYGEVTISTYTLSSESCNTAYYDGTDLLFLTIEGDVVTSCLEVSALNETELTLVPTAGIAGTGGLVFQRRD